MTPMHSHRLDLDLHRLELRFAASRLVRAQALERIAQCCQRRGEIPQKWALKFPHFVSDQSRP
jgi:hypothetical protein